MDLTGQTINERYHILEPLGQGGMAVVYKAVDLRLERTVAIKVIRKTAIPLEQMAGMLKRFEREAKAVASLDHANIIKVHDFGEHDGSPYLVMQYLPGGSLKQKTGKPLPYREAARLLLPIARALDYAHRRGVLHRDIKPANILINEDGIPMLSDFGIAKMLEHTETTQLTGTGVGIGTPEYMPPEQWIGKPVAQSDIYALGVVLYELITGRKPFIADTPPALLLKIVNDPLPRPKLFVPDLPQAVENVIIKALEKKAEARYASMGEFVSALEKMRDGTMEEDVPQPRPFSPGEKGAGSPPAPVETITPPPVGTKEKAAVAQPAGRSNDFSRYGGGTAPQPRTFSPGEKGATPRPDGERSRGAGKNWLWLLAGGGGLVLLTVLITAAVLIIRAGDRTDAIRTQAAAVQKTTLAAPTATATVPPTATITVTRTKKFTVTPVPPTATPTLLPGPVLAGTPYPRSGQPISAGNTDRVVQLARWGKGIINRVVFSPDGSLLAVASSIGIYLYDAGNLAEGRFIETNDWVSSVAFSPDGEVLASGSWDGTVRLWRVSDGAPLRTLEGHTSEVTSVAFSPDGEVLASGSWDGTVRLWGVP